jgi:hypothetical protein
VNTESTSTAKRNVANSSLRLVDVIYDWSVRKSTIQVLEAKIHWSDACDNFKQLTGIALEGPNVTDADRAFCEKNKYWLGLSTIFL